MLVLNLMIFFVVLFGVIAVGYSLYLFKKDKESGEILNNKIDESFKIINDTLERIENENNELTKVSELIFKEVDEKYQELLLLYGLIQEQSAIFNSDSTSEVKKSSIELKHKNIKKSNNDFVFKNKNSKEIIELNKAGMSDIDIAKKLGIGAGEVQLILNITNHNF